MAWSGDILNDKLYFPEFATFEFTVPDAGAVIFIDNCCIPNKAANPVGADDADGLVLRPGVRGDAHRVERVRHARCPTAGRSCRRTPRAAKGRRQGGPADDREQPLRVPRRRVRREAAATTACWRGTRSRRGTTSSTRSSWRRALPERADEAVASAPYGLGDARRCCGCSCCSSSRCSRWSSLSLQTGNSLEGFRQTFRFANLHRRAVRRTGQFIIRSIRNAAIVTSIALLLAYPVAYWIAFYGGKLQDRVPVPVAAAVLHLVRDPNGGVELHPVRRRHHLRDAEEHSACCPTTTGCWARPSRCVAGITYNLLAVHDPAAVRLARADRPTAHRGVEGPVRHQVRGLHQGRAPALHAGVFAAVLLTSIPAIGDYVNAVGARGPGTTMIGNVIQSEFLEGPELSRGGGARRSC